MRPLIYIIFIKKIGIKSWKPWLLSLAVDISSMGFLRYATQTRQGNKNNFVTISESEKDEASRILFRYFRFTINIDFYNVKYLML